MYRQAIKQASAQGIAAGALATARIPTVGTHSGVYLRCLTAAGVGLTRAQMIADIDTIVMRINGEQIVDANVTFLLDLQKYYGDAIGAGNVDGIIPIYFARPHLATDQERALFSLGMAGVTSFTFDIKIDGVAQLSTIEVYSEVTPETRILGQHVRIAKYPQSFASTGLQEVSSLPHLNAPDKGYLALHVEAGAGTFDKVNVKVGGFSIWEDIPPNLAKVLLQRDLRTPQTGYYHVDFARSRDLAGFLPMAGVKDFRQQITWSGAAPGNFDIFTEELHGLRTR